MSTQLSKRYAQALYEVLPPQTLQSAVSEFKQATAVLQDPQIREVFFHPRTPMNQKAQLVKLMDLSPILENFFLLTIEKSRDRLLPSMLDEFEKLVLAAHKTTTAQVLSAVPLQPQTVERIKRQLERMSGKTVVLESTVDPNMGGGLIIKMDGYVIDGSVNSSLQLLTKELLETNQ